MKTKIIITTNNYLKTIIYTMITIIILTNMLFKPIESKTLDIFNKQITRNLNNNNQTANLKYLSNFKRSLYQLETIFNVSTTGGVNNNTRVSIDTFSNGEMIVVWCAGNEVYGKILLADGETSIEEFVINSNDNGKTSLSKVSTKDNNAYITWVANNNNIYLNSVNNSGVVGIDQLISNETSNVTSLSIATCNDHSSSVVWLSDKIYIKFYSYTSVIGTKQQIGTNNINYYGPSCACYTNSIQKNITLLSYVYSTTNEGSTVLIATYIDEVVSGSNFEVSTSTSSSLETDVEFMPDGSSLVVWSDDNNRKIWGRYLDKTRIPTDQEEFEISKTIKKFSEPHVSTYSNGVLVTWFYDNTSIYGQFLNALMKKDENEFRINGAKFVSSTIKESSTTATIVWYNLDKDYISGIQKVPMVEICPMNNENLNIIYNAVSSKGNYLTLESVGSPKFFSLTYSPAFTSLCKNCITYSGGIYNNLSQKIVPAAQGEYFSSNYNVLSDQDIEVIKQSCKNNDCKINLKVINACFDNMIVGQWVENLESIPNTTAEVFFTIAVKNSNDNNTDPPEEIVIDADIELLECTSTEICIKVHNPALLYQVGDYFYFKLKTVDPIIKDLDLNEFRYSLGGTEFTAPSTDLAPVNPPNTTTDSVEPIFRWHINIANQTASSNLTLTIVAGVKLVDGRRALISSSVNFQIFKSLPMKLNIIVLPEKTTDIDNSAVDSAVDTIQNKKKLSGGAIAGIACGSLAFLAAVGGIIWFFAIRRKKLDDEEKK